MDINMNNLGVPTKLRNLIMDSYKNTTVRIWSCGTASNPIDIKKGVKQGCPLSPLLFDLCVDPLITLIKKHTEDGYTAEGLETATIQAYADDMILISNSEEGLQRQINRAENFFKFANISLNPNKCEVISIKPSKKDRGITISNVLKQYVMNREFVKYLGIPLGSRKISKKKFIDAKFSKIYEELDKCELWGLAINQQVKVIRSFICNKLYFIFSNMEVGSTYLDELDRRIRKVINRFTGGQSIQKSYLYASAKFGGLGLPCMRDEYAAYKVSHVANLLSTKEGKKILM
jgi:hypothetical protein